MKQPSIKTGESEEVRGDTKTFLSGVFVLSLSTVVVKVLGLASKIPLIARLGAEGMGYFNSAYEVYALLCVISTAGLPTALSMLISSECSLGGNNRIARIYRSALGVFVLLGAAGSCALIFFAEPLSVWIENPLAEPCILAIAPALLFVCVSSAIRGYFQGLRHMTPTAISQMLEAIGKLLFGVLLADLALNRGESVPVAAAWAVLGVSIGCFLSAVYLVIRKFFDSVRSKSSSKMEEKAKGAILRQLFKIAIPITLSSAVISMTRLVDMTLMIRRLQDIGMTVVEANRIFGAYTTLALPVFALLPSLIAPISMALIPQLNAAVSRGAEDGQGIAVETSLRLTVLLAMPASMGIVLFAEPILGLLFSGEPEAIALSAPLLSVLGMSVLLSGLITTTNAVLQSYRRVVLPIVSMGAGVLVKVFSEYFLLGVPKIGALGAPISTLLCNLTVVVINLVFLVRCTKGIRIGFSSLLWRPLVPSILSVLAAFAVYLPFSQRIGNGIALMLAILVAVGLYIAVSFLVGSLKKEDLYLLPFGEKLMRKRVGKTDQKRCNR